MKPRFVHAVLATAALWSGLATVSHAQDTNTYFYLVHALPGRNLSATENPALPVDLSVNGTCVAKGISYGDIRGPYSVPAGTLDFVVSMADSITPCGNPARFSGSSTMLAGNTYLGVVSLNGANAIAGDVYPLDLSATAPGKARAFVVNATNQDLDAIVSAQPSNDGAGARFPVPAHALRVASPPLGPYYTSIYLSQTNTLEAGPVMIETQARDAYIYVFAGAATNATVEFLGPKLIHGVF